MAGEYKKKLSKAINMLPLTYQTEYKEALRKNKFNLEIYVPQNLMSKKTNSTRNYLRNKIIEFDDNYQEEKDILEGITKETKNFSKKYQRLIIDEEDKDGRNRFLKIYGQEIEDYKDKGYDMNKVFTKRNMFEASLLLEDAKKFAMIMKNSDPKIMKKEKDFLKMFKANVFKQNKKMGRKPGKKAYRPSQIGKLPPIQESYQSIEADNLKLNYDILQTEKTFADLSFKNDEVNELNSDSKTIHQSDNVIDISKYKKRKKKPSQALSQEDLFISSKGMKIVLNPIDQNQFSLRKYSITKKRQKKKSNKQTIKLLEVVDNTQERTELAYLYDGLQKGSYQTEAPKIQAYLSKYKNKKIDPLK